MIFPQYQNDKTIKIMPKTNSLGACESPSDSIRLSEKLKKQQNQKTKKNKARKTSPHTLPLMLLLAVAALAVSILYIYTFRVFDGAEDIPMPAVNVMERIESYDFIEATLAETFQWRRVAGERMLLCWERAFSVGFGERLSCASCGSLRSIL